MRHLFAVASLAALAACASSPKERPRHQEISKASPHQKVGARYKINGRWYEPRHQPDYDKRGVASWYGPQFHGKLTANGELFDMNRLTAAHTTLPLPSLVRVTNLENGKTAVLRVNDRGPFADDRIIDLSRAAAEKLGSKNKGLARVRVEYVGPAPMEQAITRLGEPEAYADGTYAAVADPAPQVRGQVAETVRTRIEEGEELPVRAERVGGIAIVVAEAEDAIIEIPVSSPATVDASSTVEAVTGPQWYVQVGAYADPGNAARASARLPEAVPIALTTDDVGLSRLRIGPYRDEFPAREALRVALNAGFADASIVMLD